VCVCTARRSRPEMSGLSYFAIQPWIFKTQSKTNHNPNFFEIKSPNKSKKLTKYSFFITNITHRPVTSLGHQGGEEFLSGAQHFSTMSNSFKLRPKHFSRGVKICPGALCPPVYGSDHEFFFDYLSPNLVLNLWSDLQSGSNPDSTKSNIVRT